MTGGDFLDSNVVVYAFQLDDAQKRTIARRLIAEPSSEGPTISFQVVTETLNILTQKLVPPLTEDESRSVLDSVLRPMWTVNPSPELYRRALAIRARYHYSFYDSLIVAAALEAECDRLYSEDLRNGHQIEGLTVVNPFTET